MKKRVLGALSLAGLVGAAAASGAVAEQRFEAEKVLLNQDALLENKFTDTKWNLWSTDQDAMKKWSGGVVIQSHPVKADRAPGEGLPVLKFSIPLPAEGQYDVVSAGIPRLIGLSTDGGKTWRKFSGGVIASGVNGAKGPFEFQMAACYVFPSNPGATYIDYFTVTPTTAKPAAKATPRVAYELANPGFEEGSGNKLPGWTFWKRENVDTRVTQSADAPHSGKYAARMTTLGKLDWAFSNRSFPVKPGDVYEFSGWVKNLSGQVIDAEIQINGYAGNKIVKYDLAESKLKPATGEWKEFSGKVTVPYGVDKLTFRLSGRGISDFMLDDFAFRSAGSVNVDKLTLTNADFETGKLGDRPAQWGLWSREANVAKAVCVADAKSGKMAAHVTSSGERDWAFNGTGVHAVAPGDAYRVTIWAKGTLDKNSSATVQLTGYKDRKQVSFSIGDVPISALTGEWKEFSGVIKVPSNINGISFRVIGNGKTDLYLDDLSIVKTSADAAAAAMPEVKKKPYKPVVGFAKQRVEEKLDRSLVAMPVDNAVYLTWRLLKNDAKEIAFDLFRVVDGKETKLNTAPLRQTTDFVDSNPVPKARYTVRPAAGFQGLAGEATVRPATDDNPRLAFSLSDPKARVDKVGIGDLDGDGRYDYVLRLSSGNVDPWYLFWKPSPDTYKLEAYNADGKRLWTFDQGWNIERGIWYAPYIVYDFNGDGKAEVALKYAEGPDLRDKEGKVQTGKEYLAVLDGVTGKVIAKAPWPSRDGFQGMNMAYNYFSRNQLAIAYLDGKTPCIIALRGTYSLMLADAWQLKDGKLEQLWSYSSKGLPREWQGQGAHGTRVGDLDGDGRDEIILGSAALDDDGQPMWTTGHGHPDYLYLSDIDPKNPGLEVATVLESACPRGGGMTVADAKTGKPLWELQTPTRHMHYGYGADLDARHRGLEIGGVDVGGGEKKERELGWLFSGDGKILESGKKLTEWDSIRTIFWDADLQREIARNTPMDFGGGPAGGRTEGTFIMAADVLGDWREEMLVSSRGEFRIYSTTIPAMDRRVCLMQDPIYRLGTATSSMGYIYDGTLSYLPTSVSPNLNLTLKSEGLKKTLQVVTSSPLDQGVEGQMKLIAPAGMTLEPAQWTVSLKPGAMEVAEVKTTVTGTLKAPIRAELTLKDGTVLKGQVATAIRKPQSQVIKPVGFVAEAETPSAENGGKVVVREDKVGVSGKSISHWDSKGHFLTWAVNLPTAGKYFMQIRYCSGDTATRTILINQENLGSFKLPGTGGMGSSAEDWDLYTVGHGGGQMVLSLPAGKQTIEIRNEAGGMLNMDYISLVPAKN